MTECKLLPQRTNLYNLISVQQSFSTSPASRLLSARSLRASHLYCNE